MNNKPKVLFLDIETSPNVAYVWGKWQQNVIRFKDEWKILGFAAKWLDGKIITSYNINEDIILLDLFFLLDEADFVIAHNGDRFDIRKINAKFLEYKFSPPSPYQTIDTKKVLKRYFAFNSNKLDDICQLLKFGKKMPHEGFDLWLQVMAGDKVAINKMRRYNIQDVKLLEKLYLRLLPWIKNHPNYANYSTNRVCPKCGSSNFQSRGTVWIGKTQHQRYRCNKCGGWYRGPLKGNKPILNL